jgi:hypothetical protein
MAKAPTCTRCGQSLHVTRQVERFGVWMPPLKATIVDVIHLTGEAGISTYDLHNQIYRDCPPRARATIRTHIWMINELTEFSGWHIVCEGRSKHARYYFKRRKVRKLA